MLKHLLVVSAVLSISTLTLLAQDKEKPKASPDAAQAVPTQRQFPVVLNLNSAPKAFIVTPTCSVPLLQAKPTTRAAENTIKPKSGDYKIRYVEAPAPPCPRD